MIDVLSPCVTFNDHDGSTKSYAYVKDHDEPLGEVSFVPFFEDITVEYEPGTTTAVKMHDGSQLYLQEGRRGLQPDGQDDGACGCCTRRRAAASSRPACSTSSRTRKTSSTLLNLVDEPLAGLPLERVRPGKAVLDEVMESLR